MGTSLRDQVVFHLTGRPAADAAVVPGMRPALFAAYRNLADLRYDFPVVLTSESQADDEYAQSLTETINRALRKVAAPGVTGESIRRRVLKVEREIRARMATGPVGSLRQAWDTIEAEHAATASEPHMRDVRKARDALGVDGELADCDQHLPARFVRHAWSVAQREKAQAAQQRIRRLVIRLDDILRADYLRSSDALQEPALSAAFGSAHRAMFDFKVMSTLLARAGKHGSLGEPRRRRIERALAALRAQRFFAVATGAAPPAGAHEFAFDTTGAALEAFRQRVPEMVDLLKALHVAELESDGAYVEGVHDAIVDALDAQSIAPADLEFFPDYLVCLAADAGHAKDAGSLTAALSSGVPLKIVAQVDDLLQEAAVGQGHFAYGVRSSQLASAAIALEETFVLQTAASNLLQLRRKVLRGLRYRGPALFSIFAPAAGANRLPSYLVSAAAMHARAFPAFSYDPSAGPDLSSRFSLENNPQPEADWPVETLSYADPELQSVTEEVAFTLLDFAACDPRCARHFAPAPRAAWNDGMIPAHQWLANPPSDPSLGVPYVLAVDDGNLLCRLVVDERLVRAAQRCREGWHRLQELGGVHDSRVERLLARERQAWEEQHRQAKAAAAVAAPSERGQPAEPAKAASVASAPAAEAEPARNPDEAYIETLRCSTCNECTTAFPRMFAYNENQQAFIKDLKAGTFRQLVEAAESCQVSVIHPGKPWDPNEAGLEELIERAKPFL
jgi:hypothetical protein